MKRIILANLNGHKLSFLLKLSAAARPKRKERLFSTQITPQEKDPAVGINGFEGVGPEWLLFQKKDGHCLRFLKEIRFEGGERETDLWVHALFEIAPIFLNFPFFSFYFISYLFSFGSCSVSFFHSENVLCFRSPFTEHGKGLFITLAVVSVLRSCPLTTFVWSGCTCRPHCATPTLARQRRTCFIPLYVVAFLPATTLMPSLSTLRVCTQRFPLKLPLLSGQSSQQDVPPKRGLGRSRE